MDILNTIISWIQNLFTWWVIVMPWEQGIRVRLGTNTTILNSGFHWKFPFIDSVYLQTVKQRMIHVPMQTITTKDEKTITLMIGIGYTIGNIELLYNTLYHPETTIQCITMGKISDYISNNYLVECNQKYIVENIIKQNDMSEYGIDNLTINVLNFAVVRTYRLLQDNSIMYGEQLTMEEHGKKNNLN